MPPLVDPETWATCQARIAAGAAYKPRPQSEWLLSGLLECGYCGASMAGGTDKRNVARGYAPWRFHRCDRKRRAGTQACPEQHHVNADVLERRVVQLVLDRILTPEHVAQFMAELQERLGGRRLAEEIADLDDRIAGVAQGISNLLDTVERLGLAAGAVTERLARRQAELEALAGRRAEKLRQQKAFARAVAPEELAVVLTALRDKIMSDEAPVAQRALKAFAEKVVVKLGELRVDYQRDFIRAPGSMPPRGCELISCTRWRGNWRAAGLQR